MEPVPLGKKNPSGLFLVIALVLSLALIIFMAWMWSEAVKARVTLVQKVSQVESERSILSSELAQAKSANESLKGQVEEMDQALEEAKIAQQASGLELQKRDQEIQGLKSKYEGRIAQLEEDVKRYADFSAILAAEMKPIKDVLLPSQSTPGGSSWAEGAEGSTSRLVSFSETETIPAAGFEKMDLVAGEILAVNRQFGFIITSIGAGKGAKPGRVIQVYRRGEPLGLGRIERVQDAVSAASVVSADLISRIEKGDRVVLL